MIKVYVPENEDVNIKMLKLGMLCGYERLHPESQITKAKSIITQHIAKNKDIKILTHSALFLEGLEIYGKWHNVDMKFYLCKKDGTKEKQNQHSKCEGLTKLYNVLGDPYDILDGIQGQIDAREIIMARE